MRRENDMCAEMKDKLYFVFGLISTGANAGILERGHTPHANAVGTEKNEKFFVPKVRKK